MKIDYCIVSAFLNGEPSSVYSGHWVFDARLPAPGEKTIFTEPDASRSVEVRQCLRQVTKICGSFTFRNKDLVENIFADIPSVVESVNILLTVGLPSMYDAMLVEHEGNTHIVFDLINFANYVKNGKDLAELVDNFLTHELIHMLINVKYPPKRQEDFGYVEYLDYISFHEGFAHLLSYEDDISNYRPGNMYKERFDSTKKKLVMALNEAEPSHREKYIVEANTGRYWDKFGAIASMLYLLKHIDSLKSIYEQGPQGYAGRIVAWDWGDK